MSLIGKLIDQLLPVAASRCPAGQAPQTLGSRRRQACHRPLHDRSAAFDVFRNPRLGFGEVYMDGRLTIEDGTILDLLELIVGANRGRTG